MFLLLTSRSNSYVALLYKTFFVLEKISATINIFFSKKLFLNVLLKANLMINLPMLELIKIFKSDSGNLALVTEPEQNPCNIQKLCLDGGADPYPIDYRSIALPSQSISSIFGMLIFAITNVASF